LIAYCDTSILIPAFLPESTSARVLAWIAGKEPGTLFVSDWSIAEFSSAVSIKVRGGKLPVDKRAEVFAAWTALQRTSLVILRVLPAHFRTAATYAELVELGLRAGDALHLAVAAAHGCALATLDSVQARAAVEFGIPLEEV
jgi:predicted nucleic acid-binding protein